MTTVAFDTETRGVDWFNDDEHAFLATWATADGEWHTDFMTKEAHDFLWALDGADVIVGHNLKFDVHQLRETLGYHVLDTDAELHDTDLLARVVHPELRHQGGTYRLKDLGKVFVDPDADDDDKAIKEMAKAIGLRTIKRKGAYYEVWRAHREVMEKYARQDARLTYDLYEKLRPALEDPALKRIYDLEMAVMPILTRAEQRGIRTDQAAVNQLKLSYEPALRKVREELERELGAAAIEGEGSNAALPAALLVHGIPLHKETTTGRLATHKYALNEFAKDFPIIRTLEEYRTLSRFMDTYIAAVDGRDVVHCNFQQFEAWTGRMSCRSPNMQNLPKRAGKQVRSVFVPREGHSFVVCDYDSIEVRLLAYYLGDTGFRELIASGHDPHAWMATNIWGGKVKDYAKEGPNDDKRRLAKQVLFAITYGAGKPRVKDMLLDYGMEATTEAAGSIISKIKGSLPNYYKLSKRVRDKVESVGYVNTLFGRKNIVKKDKAYVGLNALIQGSAADIMKQGLVNVDVVVRQMDGVPLLVVHDEVVVEVPTENAVECRLLIDGAMLAACDLDPPLKVSSSVVHTNYAEA